MIDISNTSLAAARELPRQELRKVRQAGKPGQQARWKQLRHGFYIQNRPDTSKHQCNQTVSLARIIAESALNHDAVFTLESAALLHGYMIRDGVPPVCIAKHPNQNRHAHTYPAVSLGEFQVPAATTQISSSTTQFETMQISGIPVLTPVDLICMMMRKRDPLTAMITVDHACAELCAADPIRRQETETEFVKLQDSVRERLTEMRGQHGCKQALKLVELMTPWVQSPLETRFRLIAAAYGFPTPILQYEVFNEGSVFYVDAFFPQQRLAIELDGLAKYNNDIDVLRKEKRRERHLLDQRMQIERFSFRELTRPAQIARTLGARIPDCSATVPVHQFLLENW
ncbi:hypothetical protein [Boudabousia marimammalium]|uniref:DUF559 domain-containing protein n=1 Tax=Boudabousia marimammalium TaxID=156892 RepID=A0A1Q5PS95_9ACTO|nr:hypothetical protein [Boudabousia marimammalium]OKL50447.1 hypothetical protein BM477_00260 [Boudabousia marimammalium]